VRLLMCVCSAGRDEQLRECLRSFSCLTIPEGWSIKIILIDNNPQPVCHSQVSDIIRGLNIPVICVHEPTTGIPYARNRALEKSLEFEPDFIAFIDDDEMIDENWFVQMAAAEKHYPAEVYRGPSIGIFPEPHSIWLEPHRLVQTPKTSTGTELLTASTDNVMFDAKLVRATGFCLRFDTRLKHSGGSDADFFERAHILGAKIIWVKSALVYENIPARRLTFSYQIGRAFRNGCNQAYRHFKNRPDQPFYNKVTKNLLRGLIKIISLPVYVVFKRKTLPWRFLRATKLIAVSAGNVFGAFGFRTKSYQNPRAS